jgi:hypothetical protein
MRRERHKRVRHPSPRTIALRVGCRPRRFTSPTTHWWHRPTMGDVESGLFLGGIPYARAGSGPRRAVMFFGADALFRRPATSWHGESWGEEQL